MAITASTVVDRIKWNIGSDVRDWTRDTYITGKPDTVVTGIVTTFAPNLNVLREGVASGKNLFIVRESPYYARPPGQGGQVPTKEGWEKSATFRMKRDFIEANKVVTIRLHENWQARVPDGQLVGLAKALGWQQYYKPIAGRRPWARENGIFQPPPSTLKETAQYIKQKLNIKSIRVAGDPNQPVTKIGLWHGLGGVAEAQLLYGDGCDLVVMGEPNWEFYPGSYVLDATALGMKMGMIWTGHEASEEPGANEMAAWLRGFITEVPIEWRPGGDPTWMPG